MDKFLIIIFVLIRIFSNPIASIFQKKLSSNYSAITINFYSYLFLCIYCLFNIDVIKPYIFNSEFLLLVFVCGLLCTLGMICMIKAVNIGELSVIFPYNSYKSILGLIIAFFLLKEVPTFQSIIGVILIVFGSRYIFLDDTKSFNFSFFKRKDIQLRFLAMTLTATEAVLLKRIIVISSVEISFMFWCFMGLFWSLILLCICKKTLKISEVKDFSYILLISICLGLMQYSTNFVFERMHVGLALCLFQLSSVITVLFGWKIFKEKNIRTKLVGCIIMIIGSCFILI